MVATYKITFNNTYEIKYIHQVKSIMFTDDKVTFVTYWGLEFLPLSEILTLEIVSVYSKPEN